MATVQIKINSVAGSNTDLPLGTLVALSNNDNTGVATWQWTLMSQPAGAAVVLSTPNASTASFTPTKEGSYLIQLVVNAGLVDEATGKVVAAVRELETRSRIPAAGETIEVDSNNGWSNDAVSEILQRVTRLEDNGFLVGKAGESLTPLQVVHVSDAVEIAAGLPGQRTVPAFEVAYANIVNHLYGTLGVYISQVNGTALASTGDLIRVMTQGPLSGLSLGGSAAVGEPVYVDNLGDISILPGTNSRQIGTVAHAHGAGVYDIWVSGIGGASGTPVGPAGGILGYPGSTYPNPNGLAGNSSGEIPVAPYTGQSYVYVVGDASSTGVGTSLSFAAGASTAPVGNGGAFELAGGNSTNATGGALSLFSGHGPAGGALELYAGNSASAVGGAATVAAGSSSTTTGGSLTLRGGSSTSASAGVAGGDVNIRGGSNSNAGTLGGAVDIQGGTGGTNTGAKLLLGGGIGTVGSFKTGSVSLYAPSAPATGSGGDVAIFAGSGGTGGNAGNVTITAGNSTQNSTAADGGSITLTAGNNTTANGQAGDVVLTGGISSGATAAQLIVYGGEASYPGGNIDLTAGTTGAQGRYVVLKAGNGTSTPGSVIIGPGTGPVNNGAVYIAYAGVSPGPLAGSVFLGSDTYSNTIKGNTSLGTSTSTNVIQGTTTIGGTSQVTTIKGSVVIGDNGTTTTRLVLSPDTQPLTSNSDQLLADSVVLRVTAAVTAVNLTSAPTIVTAGVVSGTRLLIFNAGSNSVTLNNDPNTPGTKLKLGANSRVLAAGGIIELIYMTDSTANSYWYEIAFRG